MSSPGREQCENPNDCNCYATLDRLTAGSEEKKKKKKKGKPKKRELLKEGMVISTANHKYTVIDLLGSGGFGDVYKVQQTGGTLYALKTEFFTANVSKRLLRLKMETTILHLCNAVSDPKRKQHFVDMADRGRTETFKFLIMGLVGPSLDDIRKDILHPKDFSKSSAMQCAEQTLQSIWDLHQVGYLHRDIKPQNFAVGLTGKETTVYMLDFGIARKFLDSNGIVKIPRGKVKFIGTVRFASRNCHLQKEQGTMDDLEVWMYMVIDMFDQNSLPWKGVSEKDQVLKIKQELFENKYPKVFHKMPIDFKVVLKYINSLKYIDVPDYKYLLDILDRIYNENDIKKGAKLDWIGKIKPKEKKKSETGSDSDMRETGSDDSDSNPSTARRTSAEKKKGGKTRVATTSKNSGSKRSTLNLSWRRTQSMKKGAASQLKLPGKNSNESKKSQGGSKSQRHLKEPAKIL